MVHEDRRGTGLVNRQRRRHERVGDGDDLVPLADSQPLERQRKRIEPAAHTDAMPGAAIISELVLESLDLRAEYERAAAHHRAHGRLQFVLDVRV